MSPEPSIKPLKRHPALQPLSREHHYGLLLCWKIRTGLDKGIDPERIKAYSDYFFKTHLRPHFELEERSLFPILGDQEHPMIRRALQEHDQLRQLFAAGDELSRHLSLLEQVLTAHIRFEERELFAALQEVATQEQLTALEAIHSGQTFSEIWADKFWEG